jgi:hypothetical protein
MKRLLWHVKNALVPTIEAAAGCAPQERKETKCDKYNWHYYRFCYLTPSCTWTCNAWQSDGHCS